VRLSNAGSLVHGIHVHGHSFKIIATDGNPVPPVAQLVMDTVLIGPDLSFSREYQISGKRRGHGLTTKADDGCCKCRDKSRTAAWVVSG
jgi:FtsP/CotA-like multicopper oxidase with cupredoxin domain